MSLPRYQEYRDSGVGWLGEIPSHWSIRRLQDIAQVINGYPFDSKLFCEEGGYPLIRIRDLDADETAIRYAGDFVPAAAVMAGDVLIGMDGEFNVGRWLGSEQALLNQRMCCVRPPQHALATFLRHALPAPLRAINDVTYSTTVKHLSSFQVKSIRLALPEDAELEEIALFLDRETAKIDALLAEQQKLLALLAEKRQATISHAVTRGLNPNAPMKDSGIPWLGEVPAHWETVRLRHLARLNPSKTEVEEDGDPDVSFLPMEAIGEDGSIRVDQERPLSQLQNGYSYFRNGDVVVAKITPCFENGKGALISDLPRGYGFGTTELIVVRSVGCLRPAFLSLVLSSSLFRKLAEGAMYGAGGQKRVPDEFVREFTVCVPPVEEQDAIWEEVAKQTALLRSLELQSISAIALLRERRSALIAAAVTGQIDVRGFVEAQAV